MGSLDPDVSQAFERQAATLTEHLQTELQSLEKIHEAREKARAEKVEQARAAAESSDRRLAQLLELQVEQEQVKDKRRRFWLRVVLAPSGALATLVGALTIYLRTAAAPERVEAADVKRTVETRVEALEERQDIQIRRVERLGDLHYEQAELILDQGDKLDRKLDAIADRARIAERTLAFRDTLLEDKVKEPDTVREAREQVEAYKALRQREVERSLHAGDPFADLPAMPPAFRTEGKAGQ